MAIESGQRTNEDWLRALRQKDNSEAIAELRAYVRAALARALAGRGDVNDGDLDDFSQDALIKIVEKLDTFRGDSRLTTWATAIAVRVALTDLRRRRWKQVPLEHIDHGAVPIEDASSLSAPRNPAQAAEHNDLFAALRHAIDHALSERQRAVILAELQGLPGEEIALQLGTNSNALYKMYHDARKKLRQALENAGFSIEDVRTALEEASKH